MVRRALAVMVGLALSSAAMADVVMLAADAGKEGHRVKIVDKTQRALAKADAGRAPDATGSIALTDASGMEYFINTDITFTTSSSASGAASEASYTQAEADCWEEEVARRLTLEENRHKTVRLRVRGDDSRWVFEIHDDGPGFDWRGFLDFDPERAFAPNGRGIALSRQMSFASLTYLPPGNQVVVTVAKPGAHS